MNYYIKTGNPTTLSRGLPSVVANEFALIEAGFALLPAPNVINSGSSNYAVDTGTANAYVVTVSSTVVAYTDGANFYAKALNANTGASTININGLGARQIVRADGTALQPGDIVAGQIFQISYDLTNTRFQLSATGAAVSATAAAASASAAASSAAAADASAIDAAASAVLAASGTITKTISSEAEYSSFGETIAITNPTTKVGYGVRLASYLHTGNFNGNKNEISDALLSRWDSISLGTTWGRWDVVISPLAQGSGFVGAPALAQQFYIVSGEVNPQNRHGDGGSWWPENRLFGNTAGGEQMVAETQDFTSLQAAGTRIGYHCSIGYVVSRSPYTATVNNRHARFYNGYLVHPNSIAPNGAAFFATGHRDFVTAAAISAAGTGYTVGDLLTTNSGLSNLQNEDFQVKVLTVGGAGDITSIDLWNAGSYTTTPSSPLGVTGGTGTGATFTYTLLTPVTTPLDLPNCAYGVAGGFRYGIDFCQNLPPMYARCLYGAIRLPNAQPIVYRNAAGNADITAFAVNASDQVEIAGQKVIPRSTWTPTYSADAGTFTTISTIAARYEQSNGTCNFQITVQLTAKGTATGALQFTLPVSPVGSSFACSAINATTGIGLVGLGTVATGRVRVATSTGGDPLVDGSFYVITASYHA